MKELSNLLTLSISSEGAISPMSSPTSSSEKKIPVSLAYVKKLKTDFFPDLKKSPHEKKFASMLFQVPTHHKTLETWSDEGTLMPDFIGLTGTVCIRGGLEQRTKGGCLPLLNHKLFFPGQCFKKLISILT